MDQNQTTLQTPSWYDEVETKYVHFVQGVPVIVEFQSREPTMHQMVQKDGTQKKSFEWRVLLKNGNDRPKEKILGTSSKRLLKALKEEDQKKSLEGRTFRIMAIGDGMARIYSIEEVI